MRRWMNWVPLIGTVAWLRIAVGQFNEGHIAVALLALIPVVFFVGLWIVMERLYHGIRRNNLKLSIMKLERELGYDDPLTRDTYLPDWHPGRKRTP